MKVFYAFLPKFRKLLVRSRENILDFWVSDKVIFTIFNYFMANLEEKWALSKEPIVFHNKSSIETFRSVTFARIFRSLLSLKKESDSRQEKSGYASENNLYISKRFYILVLDNYNLLKIREK